MLRFSDLERFTTNGILEFNIDCYVPSKEYIIEILNDENVWQKVSKIVPDESEIFYDISGQWLEELPKAVRILKIVEEIK